MLEISVNLVLVSAGIFLIMLVTLNAIAYKPLIKFMADRDQSISNDLKDASLNGESVDELHVEANKILLNAKTEANHLREKAISEAKELAEKKILQKNSEIEEQMKDFRENLAQTKIRLKSELMANASEFKEALKLKISNI